MNKKTFSYIDDIDNRIKKELNDIKAVIEIGKGSKEKWEVMEDGFTAQLVRTIRLAYPFYYGFIPRTLADDKDPTDVIIITDRVIDQPLVDVHIVAVIPTIDNGEIDDKFIGIDTKMNNYSYKVIRKEIKKAIKFIKNYKKPYHKDTEVFDISYNKEKMYELLKVDMKRYRDKNRANKIDMNIVR